MNATPGLTGRRACLGVGLAGLLGGAAAANDPLVRLVTVQFGTVQWVAEVIQRNHLDAQHGITLQTLRLANTEGGRIALMSRSADVVVSDWTMVASQRAAGNLLCFAPFSNSLGGIMVRPDSPAHALADLQGRTLGVAGGPLDKSWLIVRAAGLAQGVDLASVSRLVYGAAPLLAAKLQQGELDAALIFWNFAARLEAAGLRQLRSVAECARDLGIRDPPGLVGFVFHEDWAKQNRPAIEGFLAAVATAERQLAESDSEWQAVRPLMNAADDALFDRLRRRFIDGIAHPSAETQQRTAAQVFAILLATGGAQATGGLLQLPDGMFWPVANADR